MNLNDDARHQAGTGTRKPEGPAAGAAVPRLGDSAAPARTPENGRYRAALRSCGEINDRGHWAANRSFW